MTREHKKSRGRRYSKTQENFSILSFSAICQASALIKAIAKGCDAHNEN